MTAYYQDDLITLYHEDCVEFMTDALQGGAPECSIVTDPPYGDTPLKWDRTPDAEWLRLAAQFSRSMWCFGSLRFWLNEQQKFAVAGWQYAQEIVWEKHNGSGFNADRFKRVHELAVHLYRGPWGSLYKCPQHTMDATARTVRRRGPTPHRGKIGDKVDYETVDGGPRLQRSVIYCRSENGRAVHPTQKPLGILRPLIAYGTPPGGIVFDPFAGSGSTLLAARELGFRAIGVEAREDYCELAAQRFAQGVLAA